MYMTGALTVSTVPGGRHRHPKWHAPLSTIQAGTPMQIVSTDILEPLPESVNGNSYILGITLHTGWKHPRPRGHHSSEETG